MGKEIELILAYADSYNARDTAVLESLFHDEFLAETGLWGGKKTSKEMGDTVREVWQLLPHARVRLYNILVVEDRVVSEFLFCWGGSDSAGRPEFSTPVADVFTIKDDLLYRLRAYLDSTQIGLWLDDMRERRGGVTDASS